MIDKIWAWCKQSATIVLARIYMIVSALAGILGMVAVFADEIFNTPGVKDAMQAAGINPKVLAYVGLAITVMNASIEAARRRTLPAS